MNRSEAEYIPQVINAPVKPILALVDDGRSKIEEVTHDVDDDLRQGIRLTTELSLKNTVKPEQDVLNIKELMKTAKRVKPQHDQICQQLSESSSGDFYAHNLKKEERIWVKVEDLEGDINRVLDVVRSRVEFENVEDLYKAVEQLHGMAKIVRVKDRLVSPAKSGYRDILFNLELTDPKTGKKHITELQFQLKSVAKAKGKEYRHYMARREMETELETLKALNGDPQKIKELEIKILYSLNESQDIYEGAWVQHKEKFDKAKEAMTA